MHRRLILALIAVSMLITPISAQDTETFQSHWPTVHEYVEALPMILYHAQTVGEFAMVAEIVSAELERSYGYDSVADVSFDQLLQIYETYYELLLNTRFDLAQWAHSMIVAAHREDLLELSDNQEIILSPLIKVRANAYDFNGNGQLEYLLYVEALHDFEMLAYRGKDDLYHLTGTPIPTCAEGIPEGFQEIAFNRVEDLNGDGLLEWLVSIHEGHDGVNRGQFYVLQWQDDFWVDITDGALSYALPNGGGGDPKPNWTYDDLSIQLQYTYTDGWACSGNVDRRLDWSTGAFVLEINDTEATSAGCAMRDAETKMRKNDYLDAVPHYNDAIDLADNYPQLKQYAVARLALAYRLGSEKEAAWATLSSIKGSGLMGDLLDALKTASQAEASIPAMCQAAYDFITNVNNDASVALYGEGYPADWRFGNELMASGTQLFMPQPDPALAGCNMSLFVRHSEPSTRVLPQSISEAYQEIHTLFTSGNFEAVLERSIDYERRYPTQQPEDAIYHMGMLYLRGLSYEALGQILQARDSFITIYTESPESTWGLLAHLHLES